MREREVEAYLVRRVKEVGGEVRKVRWISRHGAPDRLVMLPGGVLVWVELKAPGRRAAAHQAREHARLQAMGQTVRVLDSCAGIDALLGEVVA